MTTRTQAGEGTPRGYEIKRAGKITTAVAGISATALALLGCTPDAPPKTVDTSTSAAPSPSATKSPETSAAPEHKFSGTIDLGVFAGEAWKSLSNTEKQAKCTEFFNANIENVTTLTQQSSGVEVAQYFKDRFLVLEDLSLDKSNPQNFQAALHISECLAATVGLQDGELIGLGDIQGQVTQLNQGNIDGVKMVFIEPEKVTRYSDGTFLGETAEGQQYDALAIEGHLNNGFGSQPGQLVMNYFQWVPEEGTFRYTFDTPADSPDVTPYFGTVRPPIVLNAN